MAVRMELKIVLRAGERVVERSYEVPPSIEVLAGQLERVRRAERNLSAAYMLLKDMDQGLVRDALEALDGAMRELVRLRDRLERELEKAVEGWIKFEAGRVLSGAD